MLYTVKPTYAEYIQIGDELDLDGDEYGDNEFAIFNYAKVLEYSDSYKDGEPWITLNTSQGRFSMPAGHKVKIKVNE